MLERGYYGRFGGAYIPEILVATFDELESAYRTAKADPSFWAEYEALMSSYSCRPTPLTYAEDEWTHVADEMVSDEQRPLYQNKRKADVFSHDAGATWYCLDGTEGVRG